MTVWQYIMEMPDGYIKDKMKAHCEFPNSKATSRSDAIFAFARWSEIPGGSEFWAGVYHYYHSPNKPLRRECVDGYNMAMFIDKEHERAD